ncbi:XRE family transcriptional regulator, partial [Streptomyces alkaliphilus]|nr:XRE family transcriptional regulator [Streptomyces alkaliphilus]
MRSTEEQLRLTVAALLFATGETQRELGAGIGR